MRFALALTLLTTTQAVNLKTKAAVDLLAKSTFNKNQVDQAVDAVWKVYDKDNNGWLSNAEFANAAKDVFNSEGAQYDAATLNAIYDYMDADKNERLTKAEFKAILEQALA